MQAAMDAYKECMRNHAAPLGTYAADGCLEFTADESNHDMFQCAACGCHRNFHRKVTVEEAGVEVAGYSPPAAEERSVGRRKPRTKFTGEQKLKMARFAEMIGWRLQRREGADGDEVMKFCREIGVSRQVFKVWMHNHKNGSATSSPTNSAATASAPAAAAAGASGGGGSGAEGDDDGVKESPSKE